tara:strand:- start:565 stop:801 length:237 start_codon:yes stop_codon:yes gene_type:complete
MKRISFPIMIKTKSHYFQLWKQKEIKIGTAIFIRTGDEDLIESWDLESLRINQKFIHLIEDIGGIKEIEEKIKNDNKA